MITELWHHWLLLRPLLGLVFAVLLLVIAGLLERLGQARRSGGETQDAPLPPGAIEEDRADKKPEPRVHVSPREWRVGSSVNDRRAA